MQLSTRGDSWGSGKALLEKKEIEDNGKGKYGIVIVASSLAFPRISPRARIPNSKPRKA